MKLVDEKQHFYVLHNGKAPIVVAKAGLSKQMHERIKGMADGGKVRDPEEHNPAHNYMPSKSTKGDEARAELQRRAQEAKRAAEAPARATPEEGLQQLSELSPSLARGGEVRGYWQGDEIPYADITKTPETKIREGSIDAMRRSIANQPTEAPIDLPAIPTASGVLGSAGTAAVNTVAPLVDKYGKEALLYSNPATLGLGMNATSERRMTEAEAADKARAAKGIKEGPPPETETATVRQPVKPAGRGGGGGSLRAPEEDPEAAASVADEAQLANRMSEVAQRNANAQEVTAAQNKQRIVEDAAKRDEEIHRNAIAKTDAQMRKLQDAHDEIQRIDTSVDPGRFWASRTTGQRVAGILGMALGALGAGNDGVNRAAGLINQAIDRDIDAQKSEHELRLKKGDAAVRNATSAYALMRQRLEDDSSASAATKAAMLASAGAQADVMAATAKDPTIQAQSAAAGVALKKQAFDEQRKVKVETFKQNLEAMKTGAEVRHLNAAADKLEASAVPTALSTADSDAAVDDLFKELSSHPVATRIPGQVGGRAGDYEMKSRAVIEGLGKELKLPARQIEKLHEMIPQPSELLSAPRLAERKRVMKEFIRRNIGKPGAPPEPEAP